MTERQLTLLGLLVLVIGLGTQSHLLIALGIANLIFLCLGEELVKDRKQDE